MIKEILFPTDGSEGMKDAMNFAVGIAKEFNARIHILHVIESPRLQDYGAFFALPEIMKELTEAGETMIKSARAYMTDSGFENTITSNIDGYPSDVILDYSAEHQIDLIVIGTHGRRGINRALLGSVAEEIVRRSPVPVTTVRMTQD